MSKPRVLYVVRDFPQISQSYIKNEIEAVEREFDVFVVALKRIIAGPFPEEMREKGFELARRSDIARHKILLTELWQRAAAGSQASDPR